MRIAALVAAALSSVSLLAAPARAQPGQTAPGAPTWAPPPPSQPAPTYPQPYAPAPQPYAPQPYAPQPYAQPAPVAEVPPPKSESTATWLSIGTTALGVAMIASAAEDNHEGLGFAGLAVTLIGPSAGHIYAGENSHALKMSLFRAAGFATLLYGALARESYVAYDCIDYCSYDEDNDGETAMWVGGAILVGATLYDFWDAGKAARRTNEKHKASYMIAPTMMSSGGRSSPGLALGGQF